MAERTDYNRLKIRVEYNEKDCEKVSGVLVEVLEHLKFEIIEWSRPFLLRENPTSGIARSYITAVRKGNEKNE